MIRIQDPNPNEIVCLESDVNYTILPLVNGKKVISRLTLKYHTETDVLSHFLRINRHPQIKPFFLKSKAMAIKTRST